jgi:RNA polymerase sigma-70 factor (ECF subfamily)
LSDPQKDYELVAAALQNAESYAAIIEKYEAPLGRYVRRLARLSQPEVEDLLQVIFLKAYENLNAVDIKLSFSAWLYRIAHNETISHFRRQKARPEETDIAAEELAPFLRSTLDLEAEVDAKLLSEQVRTILSALPEKYRAVLILKYLEDKSYDEISDILQKPAGTVAALLSRAKIQFQRAAVAVGLHPNSSQNG